VLTPPASDVPHFDHVLFIFMENENLNSSLFPYGLLGDYIVGNSAAPYENNTLAPMGTLLTQMYATQHPSDPNYLAVTAGSTFDEDQDVSPGTVNESNLSDELNAAGLS
jgi:hypothetical protein